MGTFFKGWRRKVGVVTLVMALAVSGLWARSQQMRDSVQLRIADNAAHFVISNESELVWQTMSYEANEKEQLRRLALSQISVAENHRYFSTGLRPEKREDYNHSVQFKLITSDWTGDDIKLAARRIPHWKVVLLFTLLSAVLLLWPQRTKPKEQPNA